MQLFKNKTLLICYSLLGLYSVVLVYSASFQTALVRYEVSAHYFAVRQFMFFAAGFFLLLFISRFNRKIFLHERTMKWMYGIAFFMLLSVLLLGVTANSAQRWLNLFGLMFQPTELIKLLVILFTAAYFTRFSTQIEKSDRPLMFYLFLLLMLVALITLQPDLGTAAIVFVIAMSQLIVSGLSLKRIFKVALFLAGVTAAALLFAYAFHPDFFSSTKMDRFSYLAPFDQENQNAAYQLRNGYYAIGSGGFWGSGFGSSIQKLGYLPEAHTDFIMTIVSEELGAFGLLLYLLFIFIFIKKAFSILFFSPSTFDGLVACGVASWLAIQVFFNLGGVSGIIPLTGVPLPFMSYGGSSILALACGLGLVLAGERRMKKQLEEGGNDAL
ncbi:FtsW/RodA/SpoVE family cell cycle protein [Listeria kieliensis]|uniref:Probable peptidoglycan glycosyltransferase FtsW n=1 Tax=Listeria kieliensis TaxID=1621700 RepID=A0A3D8TTJ4_9LIST|nr:FtsW/RodA/SpoVE family cell cycle protein [Listeria kieliensis]RDX02300.1 cell division protein FtsW [Listeria kieliensis]